MVLVVVVVVVIEMDTEMDTIASVVLAVYSLDNWVVAVDNSMEGMHWPRMTEVESHSLDREEEV